MDERPAGLEPEAPDDGGEWVERPPILSDRARQWIEENAATIQSWNDYVEKHGIPLSEYRQF